MTEYAKQRKQILVTLQSRLDAVKKSYTMRITGQRGNLWVFLAEAFRVVALYYSAEIARCKHETVAYMKGLDAEDSYGEAKEVHDLLILITKLSLLLCQITPENLQDVLDLTKLIKEKMKAVEEITYAGQ